MKPFLLVVPFSATITGLFNLSDALPAAAAVAVGAGWGVVLGVAATWLRSNPTPAAWVEDSLVYLGAFALAFAGCGGVMALLVLNGALSSRSLTGETLEAVFLPMIPYYIAANAPLELVIIPALLCLAWRAGTTPCTSRHGCGAVFRAAGLDVCGVPCQRGWASRNPATPLPR